MAKLHVLGIAMLVVGSGCFFTQSINSEPDAKLLRLSDGPHYRGDELRYSAASSSDPDDELLAFEWTVRLCNAERNSCDREPLTGIDISGSELSMDIPSFRQPVAGQPPEPTGSVHITVVVRDSNNAEDRDEEFVDVINNAPALQLQVQGFDSPSGSGFPIGTSMDILAIASDDDGDDVTFTRWRVFPARGSDPGTRSFEEVNATTYRLMPDVIGQWTVEVTAVDGPGDEITVDTSILVQEDAPPCIGSTGPQAVPGARYIVERDEPPRRFAVLNVNDDLDIYPPPAPEDDPQGRAEFRWLVATPDTGGELVEIQSHDVADYELDVSAYAPGDVVSLRVEISDRQQRPVTCPEEQATCAIGLDETCLQRVTWEAQVR